MGDQNAVFLCLRCDFISHAVLFLPGFQVILLLSFRRKIILKITPNALKTIARCFRTETMAIPYADYQYLIPWSHQLAEILSI